MRVAAAAAGAAPITVATTEDSRFRRYQTDSVKFSDAKPSTFGDLKAGDQVRALVDKNEENGSGTRFTAEEIVSGSFRTIGGAVTAVNPDTGEIKINDIQSKQPLTVAISKDSLLRRLPPDQAKLLLQSTQSARPAGSSGGGDAKSPSPQTTAASGSVDLQNMLEQLPALTIAEMKPGEMIVLSSASEPGATRVTAIALVAGVDALLNQMQGAPTNRRGAGPSGAINFGIGSP